MNWTVKMIVPEHRTYDGVLVEHEEHEVEIPFKRCAAVWYVHRKKWWKRNSPYVITKGTVTGAWVTNRAGITLDGDNHIGEDEFDHIFTDRDAAIELCLKKNEQRKVKIFGEH
jgi:hypothetical protein